MTTPRPGSIAYHEAGHAAMALALGVPIAHATIVPDGPVLGSVSLAPINDVAIVVAVQLAGPLAEWRVGRYPGRRTLGQRARSALHGGLWAAFDDYADLPDDDVPDDYCIARILWPVLPPGASWQFWCGLFDVMNERWPLVERLARALEAHRTLDGTIIARIAVQRDAPPPRPGPAVQLPLWVEGGRP